MMTSTSSRITWSAIAAIAPIVLLSLASHLRAEAPSPMLLADAGATDYRIVVSRNPEYGEDLAAK